MKRASNSTLLKKLPSKSPALLGLIDLMLKECDLIIVSKDYSEKDVRAISTIKDLIRKLFF